MDQRLEPQEYLEELKKLQASAAELFARAAALDEEEKPTVLARAEVGGLDLWGLDLWGLVWELERAADRWDEVVRAAEILLATGGMNLED